jgi:hypothetical protein
MNHETPAVGYTRQPAPSQPIRGVVAERCMAARLAAAVHRARRQPSGGG